MRARGWHTFRHESMLRKKRRRTRQNRGSPCGKHHGTDCYRQEPPSVQKLVGLHLRRKRISARSQSISSETLTTHEGKDSSLLTGTAGGRRPGPASGEHREIVALLKDTLGCNSAMNLSMTHFCAILAKEATPPSNHGSTPDTGAEERPAKHLPGTPEKRQSYERQGKMEELPEARRDPGQRRVTGEDT